MDDEPFHRIEKAHHLTSEAFCNCEMKIKHREIEATIFEWCFSDDWDNGPLIAYTMTS